MGYDFLPPNTQILFEERLDTNAFQLIGTIPSQYPTGITVYVMNYEDRNTIQCQCIITRHRTANDANVFNKTMYIPPNNMAKFTNFSNIAGLNVFLKTSGTKCVALITQSNELASGNQFINATPTVINQDQTITPMPSPKMANFNSTDTQILQLKGLISNLSQQSSSLNTTFTEQYQSLTNKLGVLSLTIDNITNTSTSSPDLSGIIASIDSLTNIVTTNEQNISSLESINNELSVSIMSLSSNIDNLISTSGSSVYLSSQIDNIDISLVKINDQLGYITSDIEQLSEDIDNNFSDILTVSSVTESLSESIEEIDSNVTSLSDNISYLSSQIDSLSSQFLNTVPIGSDGAVSTSLVDGIEGGAITITSVKMGPYRKILLTFVDYKNNSGSDQYLSYGQSFTYSPVVVSTIPNLPINTNLNSFIIASSNQNSVYNGTIIIEGI